MLRDAAVRVEIDRQDTLVDQLRLHEGDRTRARLRDVIEHLVVEGRRRRGRAERQQHLLAAGADRDQVERLLVDDIALGQRSRLGVRSPKVLERVAGGQGRQRSPASRPCRRACAERRPPADQSVLKFSASQQQLPSASAPGLARRRKTGKPACAPMQQRPRLRNRPREADLTMFQRLFGRKRQANRAITDGALWRNRGGGAAARVLFRLGRARHAAGPFRDAVAAHVPVPAPRAAARPARRGRSPRC